MWEKQGGERGFAHDTEQEPSPNPPHLSDPLPLPNRDRAGGPPPIVGYFPGAFPSGTLQSYSTSRSPAHSPWWLSVSRPPLSALPPRWADHLPAHTSHSGIPASLPWQQQALVLPAANTCIETVLDRPSVWVTTVFLGQAVCLVETMAETEVTEAASR